MKHKLKRVISVTLAVAMGLSSISAPVLAAENGPQTEQVFETEAVASEASAEAAEETQADKADAAETEDVEEDAEESQSDSAKADAEESDEDKEAFSKAEKDDSAEEEAEEEAGSAFDADIILEGLSSDDDALKTVNIRAYADNEEDTYGYIFFWQYDGTFPDDASAWASYFTQPYSEITIDGYDSDFSELYLPVTLEDGTESYADAQKGSVNGTVYLAFELPAGSTMNTDLAFGTSEAVDEDLFVMLEAAYLGCSPA